MQSDREITSERDPAKTGFRISNGQSINKTTLSSCVHEVNCEHEHHLQSSLTVYMLYAENQCGLP